MKKDVEKFEKKLCEFGRAYSMSIRDKQYRGYSDRLQNELVQMYIGLGASLEIEEAVILEPELKLLTTLE